MNHLPEVLFSSDKLTCLLSTLGFNAIRAKKFEAFFVEEAALREIYHYASSSKRFGLEVVARFQIF